MDNPVKLVTLGTQDTRRIQTKQKTKHHRKLRKMSNMDQTNNWGVNTGARVNPCAAKGKQFLLLTRHKTVLLLNTVKSSKSLGSD
jgi:hypothetical protein